jgi:hypothetical protein
LDTILRVVVLPSTLVPAIGSAITALNATNSFPETADRSAHLAPAFDDIVTRLAAERPSNLPRIQTALKEAARLVVSDVDAWRDVLVRRRITRGG